MSDHRARRVAEPERVRPHPRLQPAAAAAPGRAAQRVQPAAGAASSRQDAVPAGDAADAGVHERRRVRHQRVAVLPDHGRRHADDDDGQRQRLAAPDEEAVRRAGRRLPQAQGHHRDRSRHLARRRARPPAPQLPRPGDGAALRDRSARPTLGAPALGPRLPAPAHRHRRPAVGRDHQGPHARRPRGPVAVDRSGRARHHPPARGRRGRHRWQSRGVPVGRDVGDGPGREPAQPVGRDRGGAAGQRAQP